MDKNMDPSREGTGLVLGKIRSWQNQRTKKDKITKGTSPDKIFRHAILAPISRLVFAASWKVTTG